MRATTPPFMGDHYATPQNLTHDACGTAVWVHKEGPIHETIRRSVAGLDKLAGMAHRIGKHPTRDLSDGRGLRAEAPWKILFEQLCGGRCPYDRDRCGVLTVHISRLQAAAAEDLFRQAQSCLEIAINGNPIEVLGWRRVPVNLDAIAPEAHPEIPDAYQVLIADTTGRADFAREVWLTGRKMQAVTQQLPIHVVDASARYTTYKGNFACSLGDAYPDLVNPDYVSLDALIHGRFATRSFPWSWLVHPFGFVGIGHNGEVNNLEAFKAYCRALQRYYEEHHTLDERMYPFIPTVGSDSYFLSQWITTLMLGKQGFVEILFGLLPILKKDPEVSRDVRDAFEVMAHSAHELMGPVALAFGVEPFGGHPGWIGFKRGVGAYRPGRAFESKDGKWFYAGSEATGLGDLAGWRELRIGAGDMIAFNTTNRRLYTHEELLREVVAAKRPVVDRLRHVEEIGNGSSDAFAFDSPMTPQRILELRHAHGHHRDVDTFFTCARTGSEPLGAMGRDITMPGLEPWLSWVSGGDVTAPLFNFDLELAQAFNEQTAPPVDNRVETHLVSTKQYVGFRPSPLETGTTRRAVEGWQNLRTFTLADPVLTPGQWRELVLKPDAAMIEVGYDLQGGQEALELMLERLEQEVVAAARSGSNFILLDDIGPSKVGVGSAPVAVLASTAYHALVKAGLERRSSVFLRTGAQVLSHTLAAGIAFGLTGIYPEVMYRRIAQFATLPETLEEVLKYAARTSATRTRFLDELKASPLSGEAMMANYRRAISSELVEIMAQIGITDICSYRGGKNFYGSGMTHHFIERWLGGLTQSMEGPVDLSWIHAHNLARHARLEKAVNGQSELWEIPDYGIYKPAQDRDLGTKAMPRRWSKEVAKALRQACDSSRVGRPIDRTSPGPFRDAFDASITKLEQVYRARSPLTACDLLVVDTGRAPIREEDVEVPIEKLMALFIPEHMSAGALNVKVRQLLNEGMAELEEIFGLPFLRTIGEGGTPKSMRKGRSVPNSAQLGSRRWGVHPYFLWRALEIVLKWVQGAKLGRGGHLHGKKNHGVVPETRNVPEGIDLISPPVHHDMYSIEDHYQLVLLIKHLTEALWVSKFGAFPGIGSDCLGAIKCLTDVIHICGPEGGTGAAKEFASIYGTGSPLLPAIIEAQHTMRVWGVRHLVKLRADGGMDGMDTLKYLCAGVEEFGVGTAWLIGGFNCAMFRVCNHAKKEGCPLHITRNDEEALAHMEEMGNPADVVNMSYVYARLLRRQMAAAGLPNLDGVVGRAEWLQPKSRELDRRWKLTPLLDRIRGDELPGARHYTGNGKPRMPDAPVDDVETRVAKEIAPTVAEDRSGHSSFGPYRISNEHLGFGARLTGAMFTAHPDLQEGVERAKIEILTEGATQAYGALNMSYHYRHTGVLFDNVGLMSHGGSIVVLAPSDGYENGLVGSNLGAFATGGEIHVQGPALDRCGVCLQGATITVEGAGELAFEYMTAGRGLVLHPKSWRCPVRAGTFSGAAAGVVFVQCRTDAAAQLFAKRVHPSAQIRLVTASDEDELRRLLELHRLKTDSALARAALDDWTTTRQQFWVLDPNKELEPKRTTALPLAVAS